jgi:hypothetical protein
MLMIECPWCGPRAESEFSCGGEADIARPLETEKLTDKEPRTMAAYAGLPPLVHGDARYGVLSIYRL